MSTRAPPAALLVLLLALAPPLSGAAWSSHGQREPNTAHDAAAFMWPDPPQEEDEGARRVFFHAYETMGAAPLNPNVGALGSRHRPFPVLQWEAVLGVWRDCNRDGHVGLAEGALRAYRAELALHDAALCPVGPHNDGAVVRELLILGAVDPCRWEDDAVREAECPGLAPVTVVPGVLHVRTAVVWGDAGAPVAAQGKGQCAILPLPRGTTSGTGMLLRYADCATEHRLVRTFNAYEENVGLGLGFEDPQNPQRSASPLNVHAPVSTFGNPATGQRGVFESGTGAPTARAWDCEAEPTAETPLPSGEEGLVLRVPQVSAQPAGDATNASAWDAAEAAADGVAGDCDDETRSPLAGAYALGMVERDVASTSIRARAQNDMVFRFHDARPAGAADDVRLEPFGHDHASSRSPAMQPAATQLGLSLPEAPPTWRADGAYVTTPPLVSRDHFPEGNGRFYWTFYARLDAGEIAGLALQLPAGGASFTYGDEFCASMGAGAPVQSGWSCDPDAWWRATDGGGSVRPTYARGEPLGAVPGDEYQLRDVDCHDGQVAHGVPLYASLAAAPLGLAPPAGGAVFSVDGPCEPW